MSEWVLANAKWGISQLYYGENKASLNELMVMSAKIVLDIVLSSLKQQSAGRHIAAFRHIILNPIQPVFALST
jgi:hypothetical protein